MSTIPKTYLIPFLAIFIFVSCKKDPPVVNDLPEPTEEGKNTFGCYVDGEPYVAQVDFTIGGAIAVSGDFDEELNYLGIEGAREDESGHLEKIVIRTFIEDGTGSYSMYAINDEFVGYQDFSGSQCTYYHDQENLGTIVITYMNTTTNIISGTFEMEIINADCSNTTMNITEGRFDFAY